MKRFFVLLIVCGGVWGAVAQNATTASAIAERQDTDEHFKRISADLESVQAANALLQKKIASLEEEIRGLREQVTKSANNTSAQEDAKRLAEKIQEVDKKRISDRELFLSELKKLGETFSAPAPRPRSHAAPPPDETPVRTQRPESTSGGDTQEKGFSYTIVDRDTLGKILAAYNAEFKSKGMKTLTQKQVMDANPNVNWNRLKVNQKIFIPAPGPAK